MVFGLGLTAESKVPNVKKESSKFSKIRRNKFGPDSGWRRVPDSSWGVCLMLGGGQGMVRLGYVTSKKFF